MGGGNGRYVAQDSLDLILRFSRADLRVWTHLRQDAALKSDYFPDQVEIAPLRGWRMAFPSHPLRLEHREIKLKGRERNRAQRFLEGVPGCFWTLMKNIKPELCVPPWGVGLQVVAGNQIHKMPVKANTGVAEAKARTPTVVSPFVDAALNEILPGPAYKDEPRTGKNTGEKADHQRDIPVLDQRLPLALPVSLQIPDDLEDLVLVFGAMPVKNRQMLRQRPERLLRIFPSRIPLRLHEELPEMKGFTEATRVAFLIISRFGFSTENTFQLRVLA